jgi:hypothetical protein
MPALRSISAEIICGSFLCWGGVDVSRLNFFRGSTTPIGDATRQPGHLSGPTARHLSTGHPPHHTFSLRGPPILAPIFISGDQRSRSCDLLGDFATVMQGMPLLLSAKPSFKRLYRKRASRGSRRLEQISALILARRPSGILRRVNLNIMVVFPLMCPDC